MRSVLASAVALSSIIAGTTVSGGLLAPEAHAQAASSDLIRRVIVQGNERIEARTVESYLLLEPGQRFDPERVDLSLKTLFETGLFADVKSEEEPDESRSHAQHWGSCPFIYEVSGLNISSN